MSVLDTPSLWISSSLSISATDIDRAVEPDERMIVGAYDPAIKATDERPPLTSIGANMRVAWWTIVESGWQRMPRFWIWARWFAKRCVEVGARTSVLHLDQADNKRSHSKAVDFP